MRKLVDGEELSRRVADYGRCTPLERDWLERTGRLPYYTFRMASPPAAMLPVDPDIGDGLG